MEASVRYRDDNPRLPTLSLGLSSVRLIVNKIEAEYARATVNDRELVKYNPNIDEAYDDYHDSPIDSASTGRVWSRFVMNLGLALSKCIPSVTFVNFGVLAIAVGLFAPRMISYLVVYPICRLVFGTLYPAYASYKAVRTKNLKEYVKWMMYWIVFALFTCTETFTDVFLSWFPFYYEVKIVLVLWLLSPATKGSSILYRKFVHPALCRREQEIDEYIAKAKDQGYHTVLNLGTKGVNYATTVIMQTAIKGGGGLVQQLRKSYSLSDLSECEARDERSADEADDVMTEPRLIRRVVRGGYNTRRSASESNSRSPMYFPEVDVDVRSDRSNRGDEPDFSHIKSTEDISSGYSSADNSVCLTRTGSLNAAARVKARTTRTTVTTIKRPQAAEENEVLIEELHGNDTFEYANMPSLVTLPQRLYLSQSNPPFLYQYVGDQIRIVQVLGDSTNTSFNNRTDNTDQWDQTGATSLDNSRTMTETIENINKVESLNNPVNVIESYSPTEYVQIEPTEVITNIQEQNIAQSETIVEPHTERSNLEIPQIPIIEKGDDITDKFETKVIDSSFEEFVETSRNVANNADDTIETTSLDTSVYGNDSDESDDEASFGTPDDSPKTKRKGKYGKERAPPPPQVEFETDKEISEKILEVSANTTSQESLADIVNKQPNINFNQTETSKTLKVLQIVNPMAENKRRKKSKSPNRVQKGSSTGISKLLQFPGKLVFWNKNDDKSKDNIYTSSGDGSGRSSAVEKKDDCQSSYSLNQFVDASSDEAATIMRVSLKELTDDHISFKDAIESESETMSQCIMEKSDALQRLIDAKLESHPEYKTVSLHEDMPTTSKSTDV